jgi:hypothetical protein
MIAPDSTIVRSPSNHHHPAGRSKHGGVGFRKLDVPRAAARIEHTLPARGLGFHLRCFCKKSGRGTDSLSAVPASAWGSLRAVTLPGRAVTIAEMIDALRQYAGNGRPALITRKVDPQIQCIVNRWPKRFDSARARAIGFADELALTDVIDDFVKCDWPMQN